MTIKAVIFDIGNVLIHWRPEQLYDQLIPDPTRRQLFFDQVQPHVMNDRVDAGGHFRDTIYAHAETHPEFRDETRAWHDRWIDMASPAIDPSVATLRALRQNGIPVLALSNFGIESFAYAQTQYDFLDEFDQRYISGHLGVIKPDERIYEIVEEQSGFARHEMLFTDDRQDNIDAAQARGWNTHLFDGPKGWQQRLQAEGLI